MSINSDTETCQQYGEKKCSVRVSKTSQSRLKPAAGLLAHSIVFLTGNFPQTHYYKVNIVPGLWGRSEKAEKGKHLKVSQKKSSVGNFRANMGYSSLRALMAQYVNFTITLQMW